METGIHTLKDGRKLGYLEYGEQVGCPVFFAHGGPGSRIDGEFFHEEAKLRHYRFIAVDRPGMGESTYLAGRRFLDYPSDISELADTLGIDKFGVMGWSGGGAHTTVCSFAIPERLLFNITFGGYTNFAELPEAEKYLKGKMDRIAVGLSKKHPRLFKFFFDLMNFSEKFFPEAYYKEIIKELCEADQEIASDENFKKIFMNSQKQAFKQGSRGVVTDAAIHYLDWGFSLRDIHGKLNIFHGSEDTLVPVEYAKHIAANAPNCDLHILSGEGHLFPCRHMKEIFDLADYERGKQGSLG